MIRRTVSAWEARRNFGKLMDEVVQRNQPIMIAFHGEDKVALIPAQLARKIERDREEFFERWMAIAESANVPEDEVERFVEEVIAEARAERRALKAS